MSSTGQSLNGMDRALGAQLEAVRRENLYRELRTIDSPQSSHVRLSGRDYLNFSSNDYLGLANHPRVREAAIKAIERYGAGAGASRLVCGSLRPHQDLDLAIADFKKTEAAVTFSSGYAAASGAICALAGREDIIILDKLVHACIVDAARMSGATIRVFRHNDLDSLERLLQWAANRRASKPDSNILVATESVFSMDGDICPLAAIVELKDRYDAWLMLDEAHATGVLGANRRGLADALGLSGRIDIQMGTLGKALGSAGGFIAGSRVLIDYLVNKARSFIFSTAPVPAAAGAARAAIDLVKSSEGEQRWRLLWELLGSFVGIVTARPASAIVPVLVGSESGALEAAAKLRDKGLFIPAIRFPTVARGTARLRLAFTASHTVAEINALTTALEELGLSPGPVSRISSNA